MKAKSQLVSTSLCLLGFALIAVFTGCQHPYYYSPYAPYQQAPYGAPAYGQPVGPAGTIAPGSGTVSPPISSVPPENNLRPTPGNGNNAPKFDPAKPNNTVPKPSSGPDSPYFEQSSLQVPKNTFTPETASSAVSQAGFAKTASTKPSLSLTAGEQPAAFELPNRPIAKPIPNPSANPFMASQQPKPVDAAVPLAPPLAPKKLETSSNSLEGTVRKVSDNNEWLLEFASNNDPFGGKLQLTGTPEVLKVLQDGRRYRLQGYIESSTTNPAQSRFHIEQAQQLGSSFAPIK